MKRSPTVKPSSNSSSSSPVVGNLSEPVQATLRPKGTGLGIEGREPSLSSGSTSVNAPAKKAPVKMAPVKKAAVKKAPLPASKSPANERPTKAVPSPAPVSIASDASTRSGLFFRILTEWTPAWILRAIGNVLLAVGVFLQDTGHTLSLASAGVRGTGLRYQETLVSEERQVVAYQSISCMPEFASKSPEEIRWEEEYEGRKGVLERLLELTRVSLLPRSLWCPPQGLAAPVQGDPVDAPACVEIIPARQPSSRAVAPAPCAGKQEVEEQQTATPQTPPVLSQAELEEKAYKSALASAVFSEGLCRGEIVRNCGNSSDIALAIFGLYANGYINRAQASADFTYYVPPRTLTQRTTAASKTYENLATASIKDLQQVSSALGTGSYYSTADKLMPGLEPYKASLKYMPAYIIKIVRDHLKEKRAIAARKARRAELDAEFRRRDNLEVRADSELIKGYLNRLKPNEEALMRVADTMEEMRFFFQRTNYPSIREDAFQRARSRRYERGVWWDSHTISHRSKHHAFRAWLKGKGSKKKDMPASLNGKCRDCGKAWATAVASDSSDDEADDDYYTDSDDYY